MLHTCAADSPTSWPESSIYFPASRDKLAGVLIEQCIFDRKNEKSIQFGHALDRLSHFPQKMTFLDISTA